MKKFFISLIGAACFTVIVVSCNKQEGVEVVPTQDIEPTSIIDLMEKEEGVKFFKKDVSLKDEASGSEVIMRIASRSEEELKLYLSTYELTIMPIFQSNAKSDNFDRKTNSGLSPDLSNSMNIITESIKVELSANAIGYRLGVHLNSSANNEIKKNGRVATSYTSYAQHISEVWPEQIKITIQNENGGGARSVDLAVDQRWRWWSGWEPFLGWRTLSSFQNAPDTWYGNVDGPWKCRANVHYTPLFCGVCQIGYNGNGPGYSIEFLQY